MSLGHKSGVNKQSNTKTYLNPHALKHKKEKKRELAFNYACDSIKVNTR